MAKPKKKAGGNAAKPAPKKVNGVTAKAVKAAPNVRAKAVVPKNGKNGKGAAVEKAPEKQEKPVERKSRQQTELEGKLLHMISEAMAIEEAELTAAAAFKEDLHLDQTDVTELLMRTEEDFGVHPFSDADWDACSTVGEFLALASKRVEAKRSRKVGKA